LQSFPSYVHTCGYGDGDDDDDGDEWEAGCAEGQENFPGLWFLAGIVVASVSYSPL